MDPYKALITAIQDMVKGFKPPHVQSPDDDFNVIIKDEYNSDPVVITDNQIVIYCKTEEGGKLKDWVFANAEDLAKKDELVIPRSFAEMIDEAVPYTTEDADTLSFLKRVAPMVPKKDLPAISDALFIKRLGKENKPVGKFKEIMGLTYGTRGTNISNLISEDYYETYLIPFFEYLEATEGSSARAIFEDIYEEAVTLYPFAVFVSYVKTEEKIMNEIRQKIALNLSNGQHILNVHGIGSSNKKTIKAVIQEPDLCKLFVSDPDIVEFGKKIYVRLHF